MVTIFGRLFVFTMFTVVVFVSLITSKVVFAQDNDWTISGNNMYSNVTGNVGIGTTAPGAKLHVNSTANTNNTIGIFESDISSGGLYNELRFSALANTSPAAIRYMLGTNPNSSELSFLQQPDSGSGLVERMRIDKSGNIGIGTASPGANLDIYKSAGVRAQMGTSNNGHYFASQSDDNTDGFEIYQQHGSNTTRNSLAVYDNRTGSKSAAFVVRGDGNIGIGIANPAEKLSVNGAIKAKEIIIQTTGWPDFVFKKDYDLMPLSQLKEYIDNNKHLPEIPSADDVSEKGVKVGDIQAKLLQKIEELTLYMIDLEKKTDVFKSENEMLRGESEMLKKENELIAKRLAALEMGKL